ncbi:c-type cytochrome domain-containing protein [Neolewinella agarilytica]|uniref:c-type cytochrome domain-containing protein n=1 Tax=Neolewinella agarilytica TaxID=478744 RepID=UPI002356EB24|nr:c-type cytochrome domain-containing protein [Neolewinella agarilytica]
MPTILLSDFGLFVGRFHPILVHLPIGFLLLAVLMEFWPGDKLRPAIRISWVVGAAAAVAAAGCGWLLANESGGGDTLWWHRWLGISVAILAVSGIFLTRKGGKTAKYFGVLVAGLLGLAGHQGGNLTHGETYLFEHAPVAIQKIAGHAPDSSAVKDWTRVNTDSINLYASFLQPALNKSCVRCHNAGKQNGDLRMDEPHFIFRGGDGGPAVKAGSPMASSWMKRITLPKENVKSMPPQGDGFDYATIELLRYWIEQGADTLAVLDPRDTPEEIKELLLRDYGLDLRPRLFVETLHAPAVSAQNLDKLRELHWSVSPLNPAGPALEAKPTPGKQLEPSALIKLAEIAPEQISYLSLDRLPFDDAQLEPLARFPNLNRLRLNGTAVSPKTVERLKGLRHLESLNLYGTEVDDRIFEHLASYPALKRLYLWQTKVSPDAVRAFSEAHPDVSIDTGFTFTKGDNETNTK